MPLFLIIVLALIISLSLVTWLFRSKDRVANAITRVGVAAFTIICLGCSGATCEGSNSVGRVGIDVRLYNLSAVPGGLDASANGKPIGTAVASGQFSCYQHYTVQPGETIEYTVSAHTSGASLFFSAMSSSSDDQRTLVAFGPASNLQVRDVDFTHPELNAQNKFFLAVVDARAKPAPLRVTGTNASGAALVLEQPKEQNQVYSALVDETGTTNYFRIHDANTGATLATSAGLPNPQGEQSLILVLQDPSSGQSTPQLSVLETTDGCSPNEAGGGGTPLAIATSSPLPPGTVNQGYIQPLTLTGGDGSQNATWSVSSGSLPAGLKLGSGTSGEAIFGTPTTAGTSTFTIKAVQGSQNVSKPFSLTINPGAQANTVGDFVNASTNAPDQTLSLALNGTTFSSVAFGNISGRSAMNPTTSASYTITNGGGSWPAGNAAVIANDVNVYAALGSTGSVRRLARVSVPKTFPSTGFGGVIYFNGLDNAGPIDVHILTSPTNETSFQPNVAYGTGFSMSLSPGSYILRATPHASNTVLNSMNIDVVAQQINVCVPVVGGTGSVQVTEPGH